MSDLSFVDVDVNSFRYGLINFGECSPLAISQMQYLKADVGNIKYYYLHLAKHLVQFYESNFHEDFGYSDFYECIQANIGLDKGSVSRCVNVYKTFAKVVDGMRITELKDEYSDYSYSQLCEIVSVPEEYRSEFNSDMSVRKMREKKKEFKRSGNFIATSQRVFFERKKYLKLNGSAKGSYMKKCSSKQLVPIDIVDKNGNTVCYYGELVYKDDLGFYFYVSELKNK